METPNHTIEELEQLKRFAETPRQQEVINAVIKCGGNKAKASKLLKKRGRSLAGTNISRMFKRLENKAAKFGVVKTEAQMFPSPKILFIDIETAPSLAYVWGVWKQNIGHNQVEEHGCIMSMAYMWMGKDTVFYEESRTEDDSKITKKMIALLDEADFVVAHNGARFDVPRINAAAIINDLKPPRPYRVIDTLRIARKHFRFERNTLQHIAEILNCSPKLDHAKFAGFELWKECMAGNDEAWEEMKKYNIQDVYTLYDVYMKLRPWHKEHPNMGAVMEHYEPVCSKCNSKKLKRNGYTFTDVSKFILYTCQDCGAHSRNRKNQFHKETRENLLTTVRG